MLFVHHELIADQQQDRQPGWLRLEENAGSLPYVSARETRGPREWPRRSEVLGTRGKPGARDLGWPWSISPDKSGIYATYVRRIGPVVTTPGCLAWTAGR